VPTGETREFMDLPSPAANSNAVKNAKHCPTSSRRCWSGRRQRRGLRPSFDVRRGDRTDELCS